MQSGYGKRDVDMENIAEHTEACRQKHVADFDQNLACGRVKTPRTKPFLNQKIAERYSTLVIEKQHCIAGNGPFENLMHGGYFAGHEQSQFPGDSVNWMDGNKRS